MDLWEFAVLLSLLLYKRIYPEFDYFHTPCTTIILVQPTIIYLAIVSNVFLLFPTSLESNLNTIARAIF